MDHGRSGPDGGSEFRGRRNYVVTRDRPYVEKDDPVAPLAALRRAALGTGREAEVGSFSGYTDTAVIARILGQKLHVPRR